MDIISTKILVAFLFGLLRFFFGILPVKLYRCLLRWEGEDTDTKHFINKRRHQQVTCALALCQSFGGGVLFATCFLHMMPEVSKSIEALKKFGNVDTNYPLSQMIICCGFFLVYFLEEFSHWFITKVPNDETICKKTLPTTTSSKKKVFTPVISTSNRISPLKEKPKSAFIIEDEYYKEKLDTISDSFSINSEVMKENEKNNEKSEKRPTTPESEQEDEKVLELDEELQQAAEVVEEVIEKEAKTKQQVVRYLLVVLALSLHAIFEGLAIGLQESLANIWYLFIAVSIHSATILFYISLELLLAKIKIKRIIIHVSILSLTSPFGVIVGLLIRMNADMDTKAKSLGVVMLEGISAGTILYITFFEVLNREKERRAYTFLRALFILSGFVLMAVLQCAEMNIDIHE